MYMVVNMSHCIPTCTIPAVISTQLPMLYCCHVNWSPTCIMSETDQDTTAFDNAPLHRYPTTNVNVSKNIFEKH